MSVWQSMVEQFGDVDDAPVEQRGGYKELPDDWEGPGECIKAEFEEEEWRGEPVGVLKLTLRVNEGDFSGCRVWPKILMTPFSGSPDWNQRSKESLKKCGIANFPLKSPEDFENLSRELATTGRLIRFRHLKREGEKYAKVYINGFEGFIKQESDSSQDIPF